MPITDSTTPEQLSPYSPEELGGLPDQSPDHLSRSPHALPDNYRTPDLTPPGDSPARTDQVNAPAAFLAEQALAASGDPEASPRDETLTLRASDGLDHQDQAQAASHEPDAGTERGDEAGGRGESGRHIEVRLSDIGTDDARSPDSGSGDEERAGRNEQQPDGPSTEAAGSGDGIGNDTPRPPGNGPGGNPPSDSYPEGEGGEEERDAARRMLADQALAIPRIERASEGDVQALIRERAAERARELTAPYAEEDTEGNIYQLDPITGERLQPGVTPPSLLADKELREGFEFLEANAARIQFRLLLSTHKTADDLAVLNLRAEATDLAQSGGVLFVEGIGKDEEGRRLIERGLQAISRASGPGIAALHRRGLFLSNSFDDERARQLMGTNVEIALPDFVESGPRPADLALASMQRARKRLITSRLIHQAEDVQALGHGMAKLMPNFITYRDHYLIGKIGSHLAARDTLRGRQGYSPSEAIDGGLLVGTGHQNMGFYFNTLGVNVAYKGQMKIDPKTQTMVNTARKGIVTPADRDMYTYALPS